MKAVRIHEAGGAGVMRVEEVPTPDPGEGEVRVRLTATGVNFIDTYYRSGMYPVPLPFTPGMEGAGLISAIGPGVSDFEVGDRVAYAMVLGSYAEEAIVPVGKLARVPNGVELRLAAAAILQGLTAHYLVTSTVSLQESETVLFHAAAGGIGQLLTQAAKLKGARVLATVSTEEKAELARSAGADAVILYSRLEFSDEVRRLTGGRGVDVVYDSVGKDTFEGSLTSLRPRGHLVLFGQSSGFPPPFDLKRLGPSGSIFLTRPTLTHYIATSEELRWRADEFFSWLVGGLIRVRIGEAHTLDAAPLAHERLEGRLTAGKVILDV
jgi:NADPH2:quinone reductase